MNLPSRYEILDQKGGGGFGKVLHARDRWLERDIAVKVLDPVMALEEAERKRFQQEARILARMSHPNIPAIYDVIFIEADDSDDGQARFQIIFEYISGQTLQDYLRDEGPVNLDNARLWFAQLASALHHAHSLGIVHRDVKPANIIIRDERDSCSLVDFGIALTADEAERLTKQGYVIGTPGYMSPEQMAGAELDSRTDVYNLGVCLYEALAGTPLQPGDYRPLHTFNELIPPAIDELVQECLEDRDHRIPDVDEFSKRLAQALTPRISLSKILTEGRLSDLESALSGMTPVEFAGRPAGQRALIISKVADLVESNERRFELPVINLLQQLIYLGTRLRPDEYSEVVDLALSWGFERQYETGEVGKARLRRALAQEASSLPPELFAMAAAKVIEFFNRHDFTTFSEAQLNGARDVVSNLLANRACEEEALELAGLRRRVDAEQRGR